MIHSNDTHGRALMALVHRVTARNASRATMGLSIRERLLVQRLGFAGPLPIAIAGQQLGHSPSTMTGLVDRLEMRGLLKRRPDPVDRRATLISLTARGRAAYRREIAFYRSLLDEMLNPFGDEHARGLLSALTHLNEIGDAEDAA